MTDDIRSRDTYPVDETYSVDVEVLYPERSSRLQALLALTVFPKLLLLIRHIVALYVVGALALTAVAVGLLTDKYPPFRLSS
jgi:hypothetical protein